MKEIVLVLSLALPGVVNVIMCSSASKTVCTGLHPYTLLSLIYVAVVIFVSAVQIIV